MSTPHSIGNRDELNKILDEIVGVAVVEQLKDGRWFTNWRTLDERDQWTADDFHQLKWPDDLGHIGSTCIDIVAAIMPGVKALITEAEKRAELRTKLAVRGDYLFMMNTHDFGRPFSYEKVLQITKDAHKEAEDELAQLTTKQQPKHKEGES